MAAPTDKEFLIFRSKSSAWEERILLPTKGQYLTFNADIEPVFTSGGTLTSTTSGITIDSGGENPVLVNTTIDIDTASGTTDGLLSSEDWLVFDGKYDGLPVQTGQNGKFLTTNGTSESWATVPTTSPAGSNTYIQYNNSGSFGASDQLTFVSSIWDGGSSYQRKLKLGEFTIISQEYSNDAAIDGGLNMFIQGSLYPSSSITNEAYLNIGIGYITLPSLTSGNQNTAIGNYALNGVTSGENNVAIGPDSGYSLATGSGNTFIGRYAGYYETGSNKLYVDNSTTTTPLIYGEFDNDYLKINGKLESTGVFKQKTFSQTSQPTTTDIPDGYSAYWVDTDDSNRAYLCYNLSGTILKVELT